MELDGIVNFVTFHQAVVDYSRIRGKGKPILALVNFLKPSTGGCLFVFDMEKRQLLPPSVVSYGRDSGESHIIPFSSQNDSCKNLLGFYLTKNTY